LLALGIQHHRVIETMGNIKQDSVTKMYYREMQVYMKYEEWFVGEQIPIISKIDMEWFANPQTNYNADIRTNGGLGTPP